MLTTARRLLLLLVLLSLPLAARAEPIRDWSGPYAGLTLGVADGSTRVTGNRFTYNQNRAVNRVDHDYRGGVFDGVAGWNWQRGRLVFGPELSLGYGDLQSALVFNTDNDIDQVRIDWQASLTARLGVALGDALVYARTGLAFARTRNVGGDVNGGVLNLSDAHRRQTVDHGVTFGLGVEQALAANRRVRLEFSQTEFETYSLANQDGAPGSQVYVVENGPIRAVRIGLLWAF
ncbi:outer membrane protein [Jannaschia ovalis]|uniref:Outer membrane beta-barrel protein n=1 Tax=Jannaschia ovalis TaxID=3038773 RepID=A0ABY8L787_9RHOB|nr:outer membrane beta-barrel protein [Jannaschia sp. GRR-S6-38]WGH77247.1 outer membrane beta-barrel protein [Jannaschia sp. GRR-S6-38]